MWLIIVVIVLILIFMYFKYQRESFKAPIKYRYGNYPTVAAFEADCHHCKQRDLESCTKDCDGMCGVCNYYDGGQWCDEKVLMGSECGYPDQWDGESNLLDESVYGI
ncbi:unnamed protein product [marine sediment metagenome]|uniref:Uncharacterized protein n=1 Tax=marine sediment metagenome TaxID=412755 RepID=X0YSI7_9ZZZZ